MQLLIIAGIMLALMAQVGWGEEQIASCGIESGSDTDYTITPCHVTNNDIFNVAVIGDSIAWGNGLNKNSKYSYLVADWLQDKLNRPVEVAVYAHSGAAIAGESGNSIDPNLNCKYPTLMDQARNIRNKDDIDLILVSGGINDVGIQNILDANMPVESIKSLSESIKDPMTSLLTYLLDETNAKIIVTGYYPIITEESKVENQDRAVAGALALTSEKTISQSKSVLLSAIADPTASKVEAAWYLLDGLYNNILNLVTQDTNLRTNSDTFYTFSSISLENAVKDADKVQNRIIFVDPLFGRKNSYRASDSFLWELKSSDLKTNDDQYQERAELVEKTYALDLNPLDLDIIKTAENKINPIAHPNKDGSAKYADAIKNAIDYKGISWLDNSPPIVQSFQANSQSINLGESFAIDYTVSDSDGSGLKQVELWRKDETSEWQQTSTNPLAGETDPVSGSFTDSPTAPGKYWYGVHVVDNAGNWNDEKNSNSNGQPSGFEPVEVEVVGSALLVVQAFQVTPQSLNLGEAFIIDYTVSDSEGPGLAQVELWRKDETSEWQQISTNPLSGETDPVSGSFTDSPTAPGKYWYGVHVVDNAGNWNDEGNSNSNGQPSGFEPAEVEVNEAARPNKDTNSPDSQTEKKDFGGFEFPNGIISFADRIVNYNPCNVINSPYNNPSSALGPPDYKGEASATYVSLGNTKNAFNCGSLELEFVDNALVDIPGNDLYIFEVGGRVEATEVFISTDGNEWIGLGKIEGSTRGIDIHDSVSTSQEFHFVKLCDYPDGDTSSSPTPGPDIDAVGAIGSASILPQNSRN